MSAKSKTRLLTILIVTIQIICLLSAINANAQTSTDNIIDYITSEKPEFITIHDTTDHPVSNNGVSAFGQTFTGTGTNATEVQFFIGRNGTLSGSNSVQLQATIYNKDTTGLPTGQALAESETIDFTSISTTPSWVSFIFPNATTTANNTQYIIVLQANGTGLSGQTNIAPYLNVGITSLESTNVSQRVLYTEYTEALGWRLASSGQTIGDYTIVASIDSDAPIVGGMPFGAYIAYRSYFQITSEFSANAIRMWFDRYTSGDAEITAAITIYDEHNTETIVLQENITLTDLPVGAMTPYVFKLSQDISMDDLIVQYVVEVRLSHNSDMFVSAATNANAVETNIVQSSMSGILTNGIETPLSNMQMLFELLDATFEQPHLLFTLYGDNPEVYTVMYNANWPAGVAVFGFAPSVQEVAPEADVAVAANPGGLSAYGYMFTGWAFAPDANTPDFAVNGDIVEPDTFAMPENDVILYAVWIDTQTKSGTAETVQYILIFILAVVMSLLSIFRKTLIPTAIAAIVWFALCLTNLLFFSSNLSFSVSLIFLILGLVFAGKVIDDLFRNHSDSQAFRWRTDTF